ncbi:splicing factor, putative [Theileria annulata]|uniref:Splicing factor, putative n=1 Tax=Theileria annulata TaxID=5874 RepID=Q4UE69_THEAN|nr:splicing factor, putative [Theileria annulata]CAI74620.1 splicing factor, putative [Theileria annulata]|eukprot:XP_952352.1 splicing factor, putative [Theileria annulata]
MFHLKRYNKTEDNNPVLVGKEKELYESKNWPKSFSNPVDITKVKIDAFKPWISKRVSDLMGIEDDIVIDYCMSQLKDLGESDAKRNTQLAEDGGAVFNEKPRLDPKRLQISLTGFMEKKAGIFVRELWDLLLSAQSSEEGIPQAFIDERNKENETTKVEQVNNHEKRENSNDSSYSSSRTRTRNHYDHKYRDDPERTKRESETDHGREREDKVHSYRRHDLKREHMDRHRKDESYKHRSERRDRRRYKSSSRSKYPSRDLDSSESVHRSRSREFHSRKHRRKSRSSSYENYKSRRRRYVSSDSPSHGREHRRRGHRHHRKSSPTHRYPRKRDYSSSSSSLDPGTFNTPFNYLLEQVREMSKRGRRETHS